MQKSITLILLLLSLSLVKANADNTFCMPYISFECNTSKDPKNYQNNEQSKRQRIPQKQRYVYGEYNNGALSIYFSNDEGMATVSVFDLSGNLTYYTIISTSDEETISTTLDEGYSIQIFTDLGNEYLTTIY